MKIETVMPYNIAYIRRTGAYGEKNRETVEALKAFAKKNGLMNENSVILCIARDNPATTPPENCRYDACIIIEKDYKTDVPNVNIAAESGGKYAIFTIPHTAEAVADKWQTAYGDVIGAGLSPDFSKPIIERYAAEKLIENKCEICVPIA